MNSAYGMNCSPDYPQSYLTQFSAAGRAAGCKMLEAVMKAYGASITGLQCDTGKSSTPYTCKFQEDYPM